MQKPFNVPVEKKRIKNRINTLEQVMHLPVEFLGGISGIGGGILQQKAIQRSVGNYGKNQTESGHAPQYDLKLLFNG